jgi:cell division septal protein FtsQ
MKNKIIVVLLIIIAVLLYTVWQLSPKRDTVVTGKPLYEIKDTMENIVPNSKEYIKCHLNYNNLTFFEKVKCDLKYKYKIIK